MENVNGEAIIIIIIVITIFGRHDNDLKTKTVLTLIVLRRPGLACLTERLINNNFDFCPQKYFVIISDKTRQGVDSSAAAYNQVNTRKPV